jgi:heme exporter protein A
VSHRTRPEEVTAAVVAADGVGRSFTHRQVVADVTFSLGPGECLAVFGPNGAGKTTLLRLLAGLLRPERGSVRISGLNPRTDPGARAPIGFTGHQTMLYEALTARENVDLFARLHGVHNPARAAQTVLDALGAGGIAHMRVRALSRGMQQRVALARALVHEPRVLLADEPFSALDESGAQQVRTAIRALLARGGAVVLVTHAVADGLELASRAAIMHNGRFVREDARDRIDPSLYVTEYRELVARAA